MGILETINVLNFYIFTFFIFIVFTMLVGPVIKLVYLFLSHFDCSNAISLFDVPIKISLLIYIFKSFGICEHNTHITYMFSKGFSDLRSACIQLVIIHFETSRQIDHDWQRFFARSSIFERRQCAYYK